MGADSRRSSTSSASSASSACSAKRTTTFRLLQQQRDGEWLDEGFEDAQWPAFIDDSPCQILLIDGSLCCSNWKTLQREIAPFQKLPPRLAEAHLWSGGNTWGGFDCQNDWSEGNSPQLVAHASVVMTATDPKDLVAKSDSSSSSDSSSNSNGEENAEDDDNKSTKSEKSPMRHWHFPRVVAFWKKDAPMRLVVVNLPEAFMNRLIPLLKKTRDISVDPFAFHAIFISIINDDYFWRIRGLSDTTNDMTSTSTFTDAPVFKDYYTQLRECVDLYESIDFGIDSLTELLERHAEFYEILAEGRQAQDPVTNTNEGDGRYLDKAAYERTRERLRAYKLAFKAFHLGVHALENRLQSRIALAFNQVTERDSTASVQLARLATRDSAAMKVIAFTTVLLLPATFLAAVFGTNFFIAPQGPQWDPTVTNTTVVSNNFWIYWAFSVPLTLICGAAGMAWHHWDSLDSRARTLIDANKAKIARLREKKDVEAPASVHDSDSLSKRPSLEKRDSFHPGPMMKSKTTWAVREREALRNAARTW